MKLIVGLGNPGTKYATTKHNIGFMTLDEIAHREQLNFNKTLCQAELAEYFVNGEKIILVKPQTFMNDSGRAVGPLLDYFDLTVADLLVVYDDLDLPTGAIRLRSSGGAGGHNGIKSLIQHLGTKEFPRLRIGIDRPYPGQTVVTHVLSPFPKETHPEMLLAVHKAADACAFWSDGHSFEATMNRFNVKG